MKRALRLLVSIIIVILLGLGVFLLLHKSRHILLNVNRYFFLFSSFRAPLVLLLLESLILFFILFKRPELLSLLKQRFARKTFFFAVLFFLGVISLSTNRFLIFLFCISPIAFPLITLLFIALYKYPNRYINRFRRFIGNVKVLFVSVLIAVVSVEVYLHVKRPAFLELDKKVIGDITDYTSKGYLAEEVFNKKDGVFRILAFGDSFAVCLRDAGKNYHNFLQTKLDGAYGEERLEIVNAGMEAAGPGYFSHILDRYGDSMSPDLVLVGFFIGNDFHEMYFTRNRIGPYISEPRDNKKRALGYLRFKNFWLYQILNSKLTGILEKRRKEKELRDGVVKEIGSFSKKTFLKVEKDRMWICDKKAKGSIENFWRENCRAMLDIKERCDERGIKLVVVILPDQFQVEKDLRNEIFNRYNLKKDSIDLAFPNEMLAGFFNQHNIYFVDLLEEFQRAADLKELYLLRDTHWNEEGNRLAAEVIFGYLIKEIMLNGAEGGMPQG